MHDCEIRFKVNCFVSKTFPKRMPDICVTCCGWAMLSDNDVGVMTSSLTSTSALSVRQPSRKGEDVCEIRSSLFCAPRGYHYSNDTVSISLDCLFHGETVQIAATGRRLFIVSLFLFHWCMCVRLFIALHHASFWRLVIFHGKRRNEAWNTCMFSNLQII